jgi:hypothetical protein
MKFSMVAPQNATGGDSVLKVQQKAAGPEGRRSWYAGDV